MRAFCAKLFQCRQWMEKTLQALPFWPDAVGVATLICAPVVRLARATLRRAPLLRKAEWLLEIEMLTRRHPVPMALSLCYVCWRGLRTTPLGHIGTDHLIYPLVAAISGFNPFLGIVCGLAFGIGDFLQKLVWPDIYGARGCDDLNYWAALMGYVVAYSAVMWMGIFPGIMSRMVRFGMRSLLQRLLVGRVAAAADGAGPTAKYAFLQYYNPKTQTYNLNFKDPQILQVVKGLMSDPRNLLADKDAWRTEALTPEQKLVLAQLRGRGMLGPEGADKLQPVLEDAANLAAADTLPEMEVPETNVCEAYPPPGMSDSALLMEQIAAAFAAFLAAEISMGHLVKIAEGPAFEGARPHPDVSCKHFEEGVLAAQAVPTGIAAGVGTLAPAVTGLSGPGPGGGTTAVPPGGSPASPDIASLVVRLNQLDADNVTGNPIIQGMVDQVKGTYEKTNNIDPSALDAIEKQLQAIEAANAAQFQEDSDAAISRSQKLRNATQAVKDPAAQHQQDLVDQYNNLVDQVTGVTDPETGRVVVPDRLNSAAGLASLDYWHNSVFKPDGSIDENALHQMEAALITDKKDQLQQELNLASAVAQSETQAGSILGAETWTAQKIRDTAFLVDGVLLTGGVGAAAGGGAAGFLASTAVGSAWGGVAGGVRAGSESNWDSGAVAQGFKDGAASGLKMSIVGRGLGSLANVAKVNPYLSGALIGGGLSAQSGGSFIEGAILGAGMLPLANAAGATVRAGGPNSPMVWSSSGAAAREGSVPEVFTWNGRRPATGGRAGERSVGTAP